MVRGSAPKSNINALVVTWQDKEGKRHTKEYTEQRDAFKARKWLVDNGAEWVDVAIRLEEKADKIEEQ